MQGEYSNLPTRVRFREIGHGGDAVLLVHGWMTSGRVWDRILPLLDGYRVIVPDLRGSGESQNAGDEISLRAYADDLRELLETIGGESLHLAGHSMGGQIALLLAAEAPERFRDVLLFNPVPLAGLPFPEEAAALFGNAGGNTANFHTILDMACLQLSQEERENMVDIAMRIRPEVIRAGFEAFSAGLPSADLTAVNMPVRVVATDDSFLPPEFLHQSIVDRLPSATLEVLHGPGHYPQLEAPGPAAALMHHFWTSGAA